MVVRKPILLVVGQNPSKQDPSGILSERSASGRRLAQWLEVLDPEHRWHAEHINASDDLGPLRGDRYVRSGELEEARASADACVTLGTYAANAMAEVDPDFWVLPHPSGLNRKLNDKKWLEEKLKDVAFLLATRYDDLVGDTNE